MPTHVPLRARDRDMLPEVVVSCGRKSTNVAENVAETFLSVGKFKGTRILKKFADVCTIIVRYRYLLERGPRTQSSIVSCNGNGTARTIQ